jgi:hypothetical protein
MQPPPPMKYLYLYFSLFWACIFFVEALQSTTGIDIAELISSSVSLSQVDASLSKPVNELSSLSLSPGPDVSLQYNTYGWFSVTYSSDSSCDFVAGLIQTYGVATNQCLYSKKFSVYYRVTCSFVNQRALILFYEDSGCTAVVRNDYLRLDTCFFDQRPGIFFNYQCSNNYQVLPIPISSHKSIIVYT